MMILPNLYDVKGNISGNAFVFGPARTFVFIKFCNNNSTPIVVINNVTFGELRNGLYATLSISIPNAAHATIAKTNVPEKPNLHTETAKYPAYAPNI